MSEETESIYIPSDSELGRLLRESARSGRAIKMKSGSREFRVTVSADHDMLSRPPDPEQVRLSIEGTLAAAGTWRGNVDAEELKAEIRRARRAPLVDSEDS